MRRALAGWIALLALALPRLAAACAVCFSASDDSRAAYVFTTVLLSILPLAAVGGFVVWARLRSRALAREASERESVPSLAGRRT
jgi:hypothetical protein